MPTTPTRAPAPAPNSTAAMMIGMNETASSTAEETRIGRPSAMNATRASNPTTCQSPMPASARPSVSDATPATDAAQATTRIALNPLKLCPTL